MKYIGLTQDASRYIKNTRLYCRFSRNREIFIAGRAPMEWENRVSGLFIREVLVQRDGLILSHLYIREKEIESEQFQWPENLTEVCSSCSGTGFQVKEATFHEILVKVCSECEGNKLFPKKPISLWGQIKAFLSEIT